MRFGLRLLRRNPAFAIPAVLVLALGIGVNCAVFSLLSRVLFHPLPYRDASRIVTLYQRNTAQGLTQQLVSVPDYLDWRRDAATFDSLAAWNFQFFNLAGASQPERVQGLQVTSEFFPILGVQAALGRTFLPDDEQRGRERTVVLSDGLWRRRFGTHPAIIGRTVLLEDEPYTVIGVLPPSFHLFRVLDRELDLFVPHVLDPRRSARSDHLLFVYARLKPGVTIGHARDAMTSLTARIAQDHPETSRGWDAEVVELQEQWTRQSRPVLGMVQAAVALLLLIACANLTGLLLARAEARKREMAVRASLGATRSRLIRQLLGESLVLSLLGAVAGAPIALALIRLLNLLPYSVLNRVDSFVLDPATAALAILLGITGGLLGGLAPALQASGQNLKRGRRRTLRALMAVEVTLALILLSASAVLLRSSLRIAHTARGLDMRSVLTAQVWLPPARYSTAAQITGFWCQSITNLAAAPGVLSATAVNFPPLSVLWTGVPIELEGQMDSHPQAHYWVIGPDYFRTTAIPLLAGRAFNALDTPDHPGVTIVSTALAEHLWPGQPPLGKRLRPVFPDSNDYWLPQSHNRWLTVIGVAGNVSLDGVLDAPLPQMYLPYTQSPTRILYLAARTAGAPERWSAALRDAVTRVDRDQPVSDVGSLQEVLDLSTSRARLLTGVLTAFGAMALLLAGVGIYGIASYIASRRIREIGIRIALGATTQQAVGFEMRRALTSVLIGVAGGLAGAWASARVLRSLLTAATVDPMAILAAAVFVGIACAGSAWLALRHASRIDPLTALRAE